MITELKTFVAIARYGTFSQAADRVGLTQAAVSGQIKRLEEHLGVSLFDRTGRSATLNADGARILPRAQTILNLFDVLGDPDTDAETGTLRIGAISSVQSSMLARALLDFRERYPKYGVHVLPGLSMHMIDQVDSGELDMAILIRPSFNLPPELGWHTLRREPYVLIAPAACEGDDWQELIQTQPFLRYHRLSVGGRQVDRFLRTMPFAVHPVMEASLQAMLTMVQNGLGVALIPVSEAHFPLPDKIRALSLGDHKLFREIGFVRSRLGQPQPALDHLSDCLSNAAEEAPATGCD
ncbi:DNA-binding transcriptional regulator, LysR family [Sphingobium sp. AP50]|uniref:LysR family transcriptional regulator n=1 Tax=Sphingobium sp. AP50 TaxID=1884369 RepID=UPI0008C0556F|nr:LysR family transcriptional regulator [Sphingobium sp. AP50]SEJ74161.1 DNA-binding transcriptional regulator, LysR family [Sphingobium sp. AP50]